MLLMPGITGDPNTVQLTPSMMIFGIHGGPTTEGRLLVDGMNVGASRGGGGVSGYSVDTGNVQEMTFRTSGGLGEAETGGPYMNFVPKTGGNTFQRIVVVPVLEPVAAEQQLHERAAEPRDSSAPSALLTLYDVDWALGGPIKKDRLWFFYLGRTYGNGKSVAGRCSPNAECRQPELLDLRARTDAAGAQRHARRSPTACASRGR